MGAYFLRGPCPILYNTGGYSYELIASIKYNLLVEPSASMLCRGGKTDNIKCITEEVNKKVKLSP
jgi:hypothetical protein